MGGTTATQPGTTEAAEEIAGFRSAAEMREVLDRLLNEIDGDPEVGPRIRSTGVPHRFEFPDLDVVLNITASEEGPHCLRWTFSDQIEWKPALTLRMDSAIANRYLQGEENLAIAIARGRIRIACERTRAALTLLPVNTAVFLRYRRMIERDFPHLALS